MIRVLTCFPLRENWNKLLKRCEEALQVGGLLYVCDFALDERDPQYQARYQQGLEEKLEYGNFNVLDPDGELAFVAHHHSEDEIKKLKQPALKR
ncbi:MAG: hypothetical protein IH798_03475 [Gemmatimonadetes bacterium]|nr:hypothetical protein [Gemmatimonadota bacterium]